ncbi:T-cell surface antigen CD2-like [Brienomyrus brachyistius]|uniref:T-cell surface antigen CD2-like n=1 Tax=Brienomyrus brachyistius TaxID=42636 RepID=UPI0020B2E9E8|nr:T-cell surface antigen CD2-like [Brienomyrus brachyistius]
MRGIVLIFILYWYGIPVSKASEKCTFAALGDNFTIPLEYKELREDHELIWKKNSEIVHKRKKSSVQRNTIHVNKYGSLELIDLKMTDSANYLAEVYDKEGKFLIMDKKCLQVIEKILSKPQIQQPDCSKSKLTLTCFLEKPNNVKYVWHKNKKEVKETTKTLTEEKKTLKSSDTFSCNVSNEVGYQMSDDITIKCGGDKLFGLDFWIMVAILVIGGGLILILILVMVVYLCRRHKQKKDREREEEELRLMHMTQQAHPPRPQEAPRGHTAPYTHPQNGEDNTPAPPRPRAKRPRPPPVPVADEEKPPPRPKPRQSAPRHNRT